MYVLPTAWLPPQRRVHDRELRGSHGAQCVPLHRRRVFGLDSIGRRTRRRRLKGRRLICKDVWVDSRPLETHTDEG